MADKRNQTETPAVIQVHGPGDFTVLKAGYLTQNHLEQISFGSSDMQAGLERLVIMGGQG